MKHVLIVIFVLFGFFSLNAQQYRVKVVVTPKDKKNTKEVYISGNNEKLGNWVANKIKLDKQKDNTFTKTFIFNKGEVIEFKISKGSWANERLLDNGSVPENISYTVNNDTVFDIKVNLWKDSKGVVKKAVFKGKITGTVKYFKKMKGEGILSRDVIVWLPPSYSKDKNKKYPVLYLQDGQNVFDPKTSTLGIDWQLDETATRLINEGKVKEFIMVGVYCTNDRKDDYSYGPKGRAYMKFITNNLKPFIDSKFRTLTDRENTAVMGSSMGGLISLMLAWEYPNVFSKAACLSPAFKIDNIDYTPYLTGSKKDIKLYIDLGGVGLESRLQPGVDATLSALKNLGYVMDKDIVYVKDEHADHNEAAWALRAYKPLEWFFKK